MATNENIIIAKEMLDFVNAWDKKPMKIELEELNKRTSSMMIQPLAGIKKVKTYINGSYLGMWSFAVYYRISKSDTNGKITARKALEDIDIWFNQKDENGTLKNLPKMGNGNTAISIDMTSTPSIAEAYDDGTADYQAVFSLNYKHKEE